MSTAATPARLAWLVVVPALAMPALAQPVALPGQESGRLDQTEPTETPARDVARAVLLIPRGIVEVVLAPLRFAVWAEDHWKVSARWHEVFYNDSGTFGVYPRLWFETGYGFRVGAQMDARPFSRDRLRAFAGTGLYAHSQRFEASYDILGSPVTWRFAGQYESRPNDNFYGLGNLDEVSTPPLMPVNINDLAVETHYRQRLERAYISTDVPIVSDFHVDVAGAVSDRTRADGHTGPQTFDVYMPNQLVGFAGYKSLYGELQVKWDTRRVVSPYDGNLVGAGTLASAWGGPEGVTAGTNSFWRYGGDLQQYVRIANGPHVISARLHGEAISEDPNNVPFSEVPYLGGPRYLRGYPIERFRDKLAAVGTLEYQWDIAHAAYAGLFVDSGRVWRSYSDLTLSGLRTGFGLALELHTQRVSLIRGSIATSVDGGVEFNLYFDPVYAITPRVERR
jgi:hypothetical protein